MVSDISIAFSHRLSNVTWMDNSTLHQAHNKLDRMVSNVAYPDWMVNATEIGRYYQARLETSQITSFTPSVVFLLCHANYNVIECPTHDREPFCMAMCVHTA